jgi:hypothetical protein
MDSLQLIDIEQAKIILNKNSVPFNEIEYRTEIYIEVTQGRVWSDIIQELVKANLLVYFCNGVLTIHTITDRKEVHNAN